MTLIELMVGIAIGLLVVAVALGALMVSRGISGTVSEATLMQQQAAYAFRVIGQQIRQAGGLELSLDPSIAVTPASGTNIAMSPVAFDSPDPTGTRPPFSRASSTLAGVATPLSFKLGYQNYTEKIVQPASTPITSSLLRDCLGQNGAIASGGSLGVTPVLTSQFQRNTSTNELTCSGASGASQAIIGNVTDMQVRYIRQAAGTTNLQYRSAADAATDANWNSVYAMEVCLELTGTENTPTPGATYLNCSGTATTYGNRLKLVFRNVYQIRSQGQV
jgi:type IV pilus assembly protein PilW